MRLDNVKGYFDVREYNAKKVRTERAIKSDDVTITFDVVFNGQDLPDQVAKHAKSYEKDGVTRFIVKMKISKTAKWFEQINGHVTNVARPTNAELDGKRFECCLDFRELNGDPNKQEACGYWVNGILFKEDTGDMFADLNDPQEYEPAAPVAPAEDMSVGDVELDF
jgi:hypothetical protein